MNITFIEGNLTDAVKISEQGGSTLGSFVLATNSNGVNSNNQRDTDFVRCSIWGPRAESLAKTTKKGSRILVSGKNLMNNVYDKELGFKRKILDIKVENFEYKEPKSVTDKREPVTTK